MELPVYELKVDEQLDAVVNAIAIVKNPAIESDFLAFEKAISLEFATDDDKRELVGAAMIPNQKIYRKDTNGEYYVFFSPDTIRQIAQIFFKKGFQKNINVEHTPTPAHSYIFQSYIINSEQGLNSPKGLDLPEGSWVIGLKVEDENVWKEIKSGKTKGFSIEGVFQFNKEVSDEEKEIIETINTINKLLKRKK